MGYQAGFVEGHCGQNAGRSLAVADQVLVASNRPADGMQRVDPIEKPLVLSKTPCRLSRGPSGETR